MNKSVLAAGVYSLVLAGSHAAQAQVARITWEGSVEVGVDSTVSSDDPNNEITDTYLSAEIAFEAAITDTW